MTTTKKKKTASVLAHNDFSEAVKWLNTTRLLASREFSGDMMVRVKVLELRPSFGRIRFLVTPVAGSGEAVVSSDRLLPDK